MNQLSLEKRKEKVANEILVISRTDEGFRVYSPANPNTSYIVSGSPEMPVCTCPDFQYHEGNPRWRCKHILAVLGQLNHSAEQTTPTDSYEQEERSVIPNEGSLRENGTIPVPTNAPQMIIKRSVSPDGRIDSLSVEFSCPVRQTAPGDIKAQAVETMKLQSEIVGTFLGHNGKQLEVKTGHNGNNGSVPARLLDIAAMNTKWGRRLFINVEVNDHILKLFGNRKQLADAVVAAGFPGLADRIDEGVRLNAQCRAVTKPSDDGRYLNIERVLPLEMSHLGRARL